MTAPVPTACGACDGEGVEIVSDDGRHRITGPCEACRCGVCGQATDTPPECRDCGIREDAMQVRRADQ